MVQASTTARNSAIRFYLGIFLAVAFFGGFLFKSWYEDMVFERDTRRLLAFYKNVVPGSLSDGDLHNARYLVYKYRGKKEKLWKNLEKKYGAPVLEEHEWPDPTMVQDDNEEEEENLDKNTNDGKDQDAEQDL